MSQQRCEDVLTTPNGERIQCQLPKGHFGDHHASWDWETVPDDKNVRLIHQAGK